MLCHHTLYLGVNRPFKQFEYESKLHPQLDCAMLDKQSAIHTTAAHAHLIAFPSRTQIESPGQVCGNQVRAPPGFLDPETVAASDSHISVNTLDPTARILDVARLQC